MEHRSCFDGGDGSGNREGRLRLVFVSVPGMGHLVAMVEFAKRLLHFQPDGGHQLDITFLNINLPDPSPEVSFYIASVASSGTSLSFVNLPPVDEVPGSLGKTPQAVRTALLDLNIPHVRSALRDMMAASSNGTPVVTSALVLDFFCSSMIDVANELGFQPYVFFTSSAGFLGLMLYVSTIVSDIPGVEDEPEGFLSPQFTGKTVDLPGFTTPFPLGSMPLPLSNPQDDAFAAFSLHARRLIQSKGVVINTFWELEPNTTKALEEGLYLPRGDKRPPPPAYAVGPILSLEHKSSSNSTAGNCSDRHGCIRWLDEQPPRSVVFLCFGSMGAFAAPQAREIAMGLEQSEQRFLWVLRSPAAAPQGRRRAPKDADLEELLPDGFVERTKERGLVWPSFAPQAEILAHTAIGGFVTHCGWNSCLESLWYGVPMAAWPLYAEQHFNAFDMEKQMGVALEVYVNRKEGNAVTAEEVRRAVTALMGHESAAVRKKIQQMKGAARGVFDEGGSSFHAIRKFVDDILAAAES